MTQKKFDSNHFLESLKETTAIMVDTCDQFDKGKFYQAKILAVNIRTLVHQTRKSTSLLYHLDRQERMKFYNTSNRAKNTIYYLGMVFPAQMKVIEPENECITLNTFLPIFKPNESKSPKWISFHEWWNQKILIHDSISFSRKEMVLYMVNKDGGGHYDSSVDEKYYNIAKGLTSMLYANSDFMKGNFNRHGEPLLNLHYAVVRQIAHELILSLFKEFNFSIPYSPFYSSFIVPDSLQTRALNMRLVMGAKIEYY